MKKKKVKKAAAEEAPPAPAEEAAPEPVAEPEPAAQGGSEDVWPPPADTDEPTAAPLDGHLLFSVAIL